MIQTKLKKVKDNGKLILSKRTNVVYTRQTTGKRKTKKGWKPAVIITALKSGITFRKCPDTTCWIDPNSIKPNSKSTGSTVARKTKIK